MSTFRPAQVFASMSVPSPQRKLKESTPQIEEETKSPPKRSKEIQVCASGEVSQPPDRCRVTISVSSTKEHAQDAKNSVARRLDYILQTLHNHQIKDGDIAVSKLLKRIDRVYEMSVEVTVIFVDWSKCQAVCNFLVEKLDDSVRVGSPEFFQSPQRTESIRRQASLLAVKNAKTKASEIAAFLGGTVGQPLCIREEYCKDFETAADPVDPEDLQTLQNQMAKATITAVAKVSATFELKAKPKSKQ